MQIAEISKESGRDCEALIGYNDMSIPPTFACLMRA